MPRLYLNSICTWICIQFVCCEISKSAASSYQLVSSSVRLLSGHGHVCFCSHQIWKLRGREINQYNLPEAWKSSPVTRFETISKISPLKCTLSIESKNTYHAELPLLECKYALLDYYYWSLTCRQLVNVGAGWAFIWTILCSVKSIKGILYYKVIICFVCKMLICRVTSNLYR